MFGRTVAKGGRKKTSAAKKTTRKPAGRKGPLGSSGNPYRNPYDYEICRIIGQMSKGEIWMRFDRAFDAKLGVVRGTVAFYQSSSKRKFMIERVAGMQLFRVTRTK